MQVRDNNGKVREDADNDGVVYYKGPLVVLVDRFSASASEIFAAAMQDYGRALIVGEPTFGKGTVQQYRSLNRIYDQMLRPEWPALGSVQYTIQKFYRVNGGSTQRKGVTPDIMMPTGTEETETGEKFEDNALPWDSINAATYVKAGDMTQFGPELLKDHNERIAKDPEFQYIMKDIARFNALKEKRTQRVWRVSTIASNVKVNRCSRNWTICQKITRSRIRTWTRRYISLLTWRNSKKPGPPSNPLRQNNPQQAQEIVPVSFCSASFRQADFQLCKVVSFW